MTEPVAVFIAIHRSLYLAPRVNTIVAFRTVAHNLLVFSYFSLFLYFSVFQRENFLCNSMT